MPDRTPMGATAPRLSLPPRRRTLREKIMAALGAVLFLGVDVWLVVVVAPTLVTDWSIRAAAAPVANGRVVQGSCNVMLVMATCDVTLQGDAPSGRVTRKVEYLFAALPGNSYQADVVADPKRPAMLATDIGLGKLWNRTVSFILFAGLLNVLVVQASRALYRRFRARRAGATA